MNLAHISSDLNAELSRLNTDPHVAPSQVSACVRLSVGLKKLLCDFVNEPLPKVEYLPLYISQLHENISGTENDIESLGARALESGNAADLFRLKCALTCRDALVFKIKMLTQIRETLQQIEGEMDTRVEYRWKN